MITSLNYHLILMIMNDLIYKTYDDYLNESEELEGDFSWETNDKDFEEHKLEELFEKDN